MPYLKELIICLITTVGLLDELCTPGPILSSDELGSPHPTLHQLCFLLLQLMKKTA